MAETSSRYHGWKVVAACFTMAVFSWGLGFYGQGVYLAELQARHGWPSSLVSSATTAYYLFSALLIIFVGDAIAWLGPRRFVLSGIACLGISAVLVGLVREPWQLFADYALMAFGWAATSVAAIATLLGQWFQTRRGLAISLALNGASAGGIVVVPALVALIGRIGFEPALLCAAVAMTVVLGPMMSGWMRRPSNDAPAADSATPRDAAAVAARLWTRGRALRDFGFWTVSGPFSLALFAQVGFLVHQIALLEPVMGRGAAAAIVALTAVMAVVGRVGVGAVIDVLDQRGVSACCFASQALALAAMALAPSVVSLTLACAVFGFSVGNVITLPPLILQREFGGAQSAKLVALSTAIAQFTYAFGPGAVGLLRSASGSYRAPLLLCAVLELAAACAVIVRPRSSSGTPPDEFARA